MAGPPFLPPPLQPLGSGGLGGGLEASPAADGLMLSGLQPEPAAGSLLVPPAPGGSSCPHCGGFSQFCGNCKKTRRKGRARLGTKTRVQLGSRAGTGTPGSVVHRPSGPRLAASLTAGSGEAGGTWPGQEVAESRATPLAKPPEALDDAAVPLEERQHRERQQLLQWGEGLSRQVERLSQERARLELSLTKAQVAKARLEAELGKTRRRCAELEGLVRQGIAQSGVAKKAVEENEDLRKQLSAYAVEIEALREEKENLVANQADGKQSPWLAVTPGSPATEKAVADIEDGGASLDRSFANSTALDGAQALELVRILKGALATLQEEYVAQTRAFGLFASTVRRKQLEIEDSLKAASLEVGAHTEAFKVLPDQLVGVRDAATRSADRSNTECLAWKRSAEELRNEVEDLQQQLRIGAEQHAIDNEELRALAAPVRLRNELLRRRLGRSIREKDLHYILQHEISTEMSLAERGYILEKVLERKVTREPRFVKVALDDLQLRWSKGDRLLKNCTVLDLKSVIRLEYGCHTRSYVLYKDVRSRTKLWPWLCFSLYSTKRSFDFICPEEKSAQAFVVTLSRLCTGASGTLPTRQRFVCAKAWCKVEDYCSHKHLTLPQALLSAVKAAGRTHYRGGPPAHLMAAAPRLPRQGGGVGAGVSDMMEDGGMLTQRGGRR